MVIRNLISCSFVRTWFHTRGISCVWQCPSRKAHLLTTYPIQPNFHRQPISILPRPSRTDASPMSHFFMRSNPMAFSLWLMILIWYYSIQCPTEENRWHRFLRSRFRNYQDELPLALSISKQTAQLKLISNQIRAIEYMMI